MDIERLTQIERRAEMLYNLHTLGGHLMPVDKPSAAPTALGFFPQFAAAVWISRKVVNDGFTFSSSDPQRSQ